MTPDPTTTTSQRIVDDHVEFMLEWIWRIMTVIMIPILAWMVISILDHGDRLTAIENNRFTSSDAQALMRDIADRPTRAELQATLDQLRADVRDIRQILERRP